MLGHLPARRGGTPRGPPRHDPLGICQAPAAGLPRPARGTRPDLPAGRQPVDLGRRDRRHRPLARDDRGRPGPGGGAARGARARGLPPARGRPVAVLRDAADGAGHRSPAPRAQLRTRAPARAPVRRAPRRIGAPGRAPVQPVVPARDRRDSRQGGRAAAHGSGPHPGDRDDGFDRNHRAKRGLRPAPNACVVRSSGSTGSPRKRCGAPRGLRPSSSWCEVIRPRGTGRSNPRRRSRARRRRGAAPRGQRGFVPRPPPRRT